DVGRPDIPIYMGGILPQEDLGTLQEAGIARCFTTGTGLMQIVEAVRGAVLAAGKQAPFIRGAGSVAEVSGSRATAQLARNISLLHAGRPCCAESPRRRPRRIIGITGSPGAG